tara:strand:- start:324 stop:467 length:144 start_codon:yes stop_codon:yes gene_type:complete
MKMGAKSAAKIAPTTSSMKMVAWVCSSKTKHKIANKLIAIMIVRGGV